MVTQDYLYGQWKKVDAFREQIIYLDFQIF